MKNKKYKEENSLPDILEIDSDYMSDDYTDLFSSSSIQGGISVEPMGF